MVELWPLSIWLHFNVKHKHIAPDIHEIHGHVAWVWPYDALIQVNSELNRFKYTAQISEHLTDFYTFVERVLAFSNVCDFFFLFVYLCNFTLSWLVTVHILLFTWHLLDTSAPDITFALLLIAGLPLRKIILYREYIHFFTFIFIFTDNSASSLYCFFAAFYYSCIALTCHSLPSELPLRDN